jgi:hypothetical protein
MGFLAENTELPPREFVHLVARVSALPSPPDSREWTGNDARESRDHHELVSLNIVPCFLRLLWQSSDGAETVEVGKFKMSLRGLASADFVQVKGKQVRLRFVRKTDGLVVIQQNDKHMALPVGRADFRR